MAARCSALVKKGRSRHSRQPPPRGRGHRALPGGVQLVAGPRGTRRGGAGCGDCGGWAPVTVGQRGCGPCMALAVFLTVAVTVSGVGVVATHAALCPARRQETPRLLGGGGHEGEWQWRQLDRHQRGLRLQGHGRVV